METLGIEANVRCVVSVSGGVDSMTLWHLVRAAGIPHVVAHVNFGLRGEASDGDEMLVRSTADLHNVELHVYRASGAGGSPPETGIQLWARQRRIAFTKTLSRELADAPILLAHHRDDQAETVLMRLTRGAGGIGLGGMSRAAPPFYRPLLAYRRDAIVAYADARAVAYREDASNASDRYARNAFRHHVVPALERVEPRAVAGIAKSAAYVGTLTRFARSAAENVLAQSVLAKAEPNKSAGSEPQSDGEDTRPTHPVYAREALAKVSELSTLLYLWLGSLGYRSAQVETLAEWISDRQRQRRRMLRPDGREAVVVTGGRVYREAQRRGGSPDDA